MSEYSFPKAGMMKKRGRALSTFGVKNWKDRWFELDMNVLTYWDKFGGAKEKGTKKGTIATKDITLVEDVLDEAFDREFAFQVGYFDADGTTVHQLYIQASDKKVREDWVAHIRYAAEMTEGPAKKAPKYHPSIYDDKTWRCCHARVKTNGGCTLSFFGRQEQQASLPAPPSGSALKRSSNSSSKQSHQSSTRSHQASTKSHHASTKLSASSVASSGTESRPASTGAIKPITQYKEHTIDRHASAPSRVMPMVANGAGAGAGSAVLYKVVALYPYTPSQPDDLALEQGQVLEVLDDHERNWWKAKAANGAIGFVPSNYVVKQGLQSEPWFHGKMSRGDAAAMLRMAAFSGSYLVRESESKQGEYSLSVSFESALKHYHIKREDGKFFINERHRFDSITELVEYHRHNSGGLITRLRKTVTEAKAPPTAGFGHNQWEIPKEHIKLGQMVGEGNWGKVYLGEYTKNSQLVAVKTLKNAGAMEQQDDFIAEAKVMMQCSHPHLVQLYGVSSTPPMYIITEFMEGGCLLDYLRDHPELEPDVLTSMGIDVASGMSFLEEKQFIHRDLAARNCLVGQNNVVKVADFGLARFVLDDEYTASEGTKYPVKWAAPEVINYNRFSTKSDVWSFGIILWEIWSLGKKPYPGMQNAQVMDEVSSGYRMSRPALATHELHDIMMLCWHADPDARPTFVDLVECLTRGGGAYAAEDDLT